MPIALPFPRSHLRSSSVALSASTRWSSLAVALLLAACVNSPHAAVQIPGRDQSLAEVTPAAASGCQETLDARSALQSITHELQAHGMVLHAACESSGMGFTVQVQVIDGMKASKVVRGPLADGQNVDMGSPPGLISAGNPAGASSLSPDVLHNRQWLRELMARHQFDNLPDAWWHFAQRGASPAQATDTDLAYR